MRDFRRIFLENIKKNSDCENLLKGGKSFLKQSGLAYPLSIDKKVIFKLVDGVKAREEDFGLLVVSKTTPALALNEDTAYLWRLIDGKTTVDEIIHKLAENFKGANMEKTALELLETLFSIGLIEEVHR